MLIHNILRIPYIISIELQIVNAVEKSIKGLDYSFLEKEIVDLY